MACKPWVVALHQETNVKYTSLFVRGSYISISNRRGQHGVGRERRDVNRIDDVTNEAKAFVEADKKSVGRVNFSFNP